MGRHMPLHSSGRFGYEYEQYTFSSSAHCSMNTHEHDARSLTLMLTHLDGAFWKAGKLLDSIPGQASQLSQGRCWNCTQPLECNGICTQQRLRSGAQIKAMERCD